MAANRPEAVLDFKLSTSRPIAEVSTVTRIITDSTISTITTSASTTASSPAGAAPLNPPKTAVIPAAGSPSSSTVPVKPPRTRDSHTSSSSSTATLVQPRDEVRPTPPAPNGGPAVGGVVGVPKSTCAKCTNISIMQLFYEMKQKFPTVSDDLVHETVLANCHNRDKCLAALRELSATNQNLVPQSYPAKSLRGEAMGRKGSMPFVEGGGGGGGDLKQTSDNSDGSSGSNPNTLPRRGGTRGIGLPGMTSGAVVASTGASVNGSFRRQSDTNHLEGQGGGGGGVSGGGFARNGEKLGSSSDMLSNGGSFISNNIQRLAISGNQGGGGGVGVGIGASTGGGGKIERPSTLNLSASPNRPFRAAPPIPSITSSTSSLSSLSTATDLASASSPQLTASNESINVSVNVTLSPVIGHRVGGGAVSRPPIPPPRHTTELTVQPELLPFATTSAGAAGGLPTRSFTSVNFTLRQPVPSSSAGGGAGGGSAAGNSAGGGAGGTTIGYPIDITTAGSTMTYSSSSYDAKQGYQSQLQITVGSGGGTISAIRTKAPTMATTTTTAAMATAGGSSNQFGQAGNRNLILTNQRLDADIEEVLIHRQLQSKKKLSTELEKYRKRLDTMQRDVKALQMPLPASAPAQLQDEIERLQTVCDRMAAAVEKAGNFALGETNEAFYQRLDSQNGPSTPVVVAPSLPNPQRPPRPPAPLTNSPAAAAGRSMVDTSAEDNEGGEGWICSQCTFQNHPMLNMCEQCGMVKRPPPQQHAQTGRQQQQQQGPTAATHIQPAGIVQITSSQFIPAHVPAPPPANPNAAAAASLTNPLQYPFLSAGGYPGQPQPSSPMVYNTGLCPYPAPLFSYPGQQQMQQPPPRIVTPTTNVATTTTAYSSPTYSVISTPSPQTPGGGLMPPPVASPQQKSPKNKRGSKFNSKLSQSISNLFSSSSSSSNNNNSQ